ncbi:MAG TPA: hypothetical protein VMU81_14965 [Acetobacteraceae bacterium]|nr:hypothetical protein [Acetobacteraceae bacterium]
MPIFPETNTTDAPWTRAGAGNAEEGLDPEMVMPRSSARRVPVQVDLVFAIDRTGSSHEFAVGIRQAIPMIARPVIEKAARVRLFLQTHGDLDYNEHPVMLVRDGGLDDIVTAAQHLSFGGGGDPPEHHAHALETALECVDWGGVPPKSRGAIVLFSTADTKASPSGRTAQQIGQALAARGVLLFAVSQLEPGVNALIDAAHGMAFPISNEPSVAEMQRIASRVAASVTDSIIQGMSQA